MKPSEYFADVMQKNHVIAVDEYELYQYSLNALFEIADDTIVFNGCNSGEKCIRWVSCQNGRGLFCIVAKRSFWLCFAPFLSHRDIGMDC